MGILLAAGWVLWMAAGGSGIHSQMTSWAPISPHAKLTECLAEREAKLELYAMYLSEPKRGPGWRHGRVVIGQTPTASTQFYLMECRAMMQ